MRTAFWVSSFIAAALQCLPLAITAKELPSTNLTFADRSGIRYALRVIPDQFTAASQAVPEVQVIAQKTPSQFVIVDSLASRLGPMSMCQAGLERTLRVVRVHRGVASQVSQLKVASCHTGLELSEQPFTWDATTSTVTIRWLIGPKKLGRPEDRRVHLR
jgi:hypothetical protein